MFSLFSQFSVLLSLVYIWRQYEFSMIRKMFLGTMNFLFMLQKNKMLVFSLMSLVLMSKIIASSRWF